MWTIPGWVAGREKCFVRKDPPKEESFLHTSLDVLQLGLTRDWGGGEVANRAERWENLIVFLEGAKIEERGVKIKFNVVIFRPSFAGSE